MQDLIFTFNSSAKKAPVSHQGKALPRGSHEVTVQAGYGIFLETYALTRVLGNAPHHTAEMDVCWSMLGSQLFVLGTKPF